MSDLPALGSEPSLAVVARLLDAMRAKAGGASRTGYPALGGDRERALRLDADAAAFPSERALVDVIATRRSGGIGAGTLDRRRLGTLLAACLPPPAGPLRPEADLAPVVFPIVLDVEGVDAGAYRYDLGWRALLPIHAIERDELRASSLLQREHGDGAALLFFVVPLARWLQRSGDRGYRGAALSVGWMTDRAYLASELLGLSYTATHGFAPSDIDRRLGLDGRSWTAFFGFAIGAAGRRTL